MYDKYKAYFETWLNLPIESIEHATDISVHPHEKRLEKPIASMLYMPICAFETENALIISCIPEWEEKMHKCLRNVHKDEAVSKIADTFCKYEIGVYLSHTNHQFYGLAEKNTEIDTTKAVKLEMHHLNQFREYYKKLKPNMFESRITSPDDWFPQAYEEMINCRAQFCVMENDKIVCATDAEDMPNKPDSIINLGINTLADYRKKGYATAACAEFISHYARQGIQPVWQCSFSNSISQSLAKKLGFRYIGNVFHLSTFTKYPDGN